MIGVEGGRNGGIEVVACAGLGVTVACVKVLVLLSLLLALLLSLSLLLSLFSVVDGCKGLGVVGSLGIMHATRRWTCVVVGGGGVVRILLGCRCSDVQVLQKVDKELLLGLLLVLLELLLVV